MKNKNLIFYSFSKLRYYYFKLPVSFTVATIKIAASERDNRHIFNLSLKSFQKKCFSYFYFFFLQQLNHIHLHHNYNFNIFSLSSLLFLIQHFLFYNCFVFIWKRNISFIKFFTLDSDICILFLQINHSCFAQSGQ